ncbi:hypothetical protein PI95_030435 [Hassallia byssoidea VB512170]|uniref:Uncharacterized protein n=1 Tax=Hassallia byssoidea VB512170 TaxID=1304833 RepID=A0A846HKK5_9CYAN|nr:hypothetical protein [Hassalia byssoidea]NEU76711.1 hypothetical protein [Hassalia byssoidea VB512170]
MHHLIDIAGITTLGTLGAITTVAAAAINPIGAALLIAGAVMWVKNNHS